MTDTRPTTPSTPARPPRSERRLTLESVAAAPFPDQAAPPMPESSTSSASPEANDEPVTPSTPSRPKLANRKSTSSIKRKPVSSTPEDLSLELQTMPASRPSRSIDGVSADHANEPPRYILPVDLPQREQAVAGPSTPSIDFSASRPPSYANDHTPVFDLTAGLGASGSSYTLPTSDELPCYAEETQTEPKTLARALWKWGWCCPLLWFLGMCILWIPLKPVVEEADPEKAQKLDEMIVILRETELKYAKRCAYSCLGFVLLIAVVVAVAVVLSKVL
ncbi:uncharacterized protein I303_107904 [Kwoniella dejecticola CBS 10117]|uniref:Transmembrane protein n=1 Tax=Kwoniella dejecticola CBS 10117 TaxID=1296121 RepID=A0A1A5ZW05_9TREE|nr:uncharacterized protein I303_07904 [Kwoniella dejecticola CBS 10117]OBR81991.1 hypothetical protein I303_07904 [Kwoniella dejecticola CBS 10117]